MNCLHCQRPEKLRLTGNKAPFTLLVLDWLVIEPHGEWMSCLLSAMKRTEICMLNHLSYPWCAFLYKPLVWSSGERFHTGKRTPKYYTTITCCVSVCQHSIAVHHCPGDLGSGKQQKRREGHACSINTPLSVNVKLGLTARKLEFKELQWGVWGGFFLAFQPFFFEQQHL